jgi:hypothetical protein
VAVECGVGRWGESVGEADSVPCGEKGFLASAGRARARNRGGMKAGVWPGRTINVDQPFVLLSYFGRVSKGMTRKFEEENIKYQNKV